MPDYRLIEEAITEHFGPRCNYKDTDEFPELQGKTVGRCPACLAWEQFDALTALSETKSTENVTQEGLCRTDEQQRASEPPEAE